VHKRYTNRTVQVQT